MDFALVYGGDWLMLPLELARGAIHRVESLTVTDTFGQETRIGLAASVGDDPLRDWTMHNLSDSGSVSRPGRRLSGRLCSFPLPAPER